MIMAADKKHFTTYDFIKPASIAVNKMIRKAIFIFSFSVISKLHSIRAMESFIVGGEPADIKYYSYAAYLTLESESNVFACGSSIINQNVLLTAAHCFEDVGKYYLITARAGSANKLRGTLRDVARFATHIYYNTYTVANDIALAYLKKPFGLGTNIKRIVLMKNPPKKKLGYVSGWGLRDEFRHTQTDWLQYTEQTLWTTDECRKVLRAIPNGTICGGAKSGRNYASAGDSGSALIINDYVQVGLVSFKLPDISLGLVVYTDVAKYYDWILASAKTITCHIPVLSP